jgi:hypothetical protein
VAAADALGALSAAMSGVLILYIPDAPDSAEQALERVLASITALQHAIADAAKIIEAGGSQ